jgi:hypothetical protein
MRSAFEHRMHGLLWSRVRQGEIAGPASWEQRLAMLSLRDEARHRRLWETLVAARARLAERGLEVATLKGVAAEARWYGRLGERPCYDVDILLSPHCLGRADEAVAILEPGHPMLGRVSGSIDRGTLQFLELHSGDVRVDLHFDPLKMRIPCRQFALVWSRMTSVQGPDGAEVPAYDTELSLLYFLLHLNRDRFRYLLGFADVARILQSRSVDWEFFDRFVRGEGIEVPVYASLEAVCSTLGVLDTGPPPGLGWKLSVWRFLWRSHVRLRGSDSIGRYSWRGRYGIPLVARTRRGDLVSYLYRRLIGVCRKAG